MKTKLFTSAAALTLLGLVSTDTLSAADKPNADRPSREEMVKRFDTNGDGKLDQTERQAMMAARPAADRGDRAGPGGDRGERAGPGGPGDRGDRMKQLDTDGDGKISAAERSAGEAQMRANITSNPRAMKRMDTDGDGAISDAEWAAAREQMGQRGPGGPGGPGAGKGKGEGKGKGKPE